MVARWPSSWRARPYATSVPNLSKDEIGGVSASIRRMPAVLPREVATEETGTVRRARRAGVAGGRWRCRCLHKRRFAEPIPPRLGRWSSTGRVDRHEVILQVHARYHRLRRRRGNVRRGPCWLGVPQLWRRDIGGSVVQLAILLFYIGVFCILGVEPLPFSIVHGMLIVVVIDKWVLGALKVLRDALE
jgi:hypothetical protein